MVNSAPLHPFLFLCLFCPLVDSAFFRTSSDLWALDLPPALLHLWLTCRAAGRI